jgi:hypothetical protein
VERGLKVEAFINGISQTGGTVGVLGRNEKIANEELKM